jgi:YD repeat-containing protein
MSKRSLAVVFAALAGSTAVAATFLLGFSGWLNSARPPSITTPIQPQAPSDDEPGSGDYYYTPAPVSLAPASAFLFTGKSPRQFGAVKGALQRRRAAVLRGRVFTSDGTPLAGVEVGVPAQPEVGRTRTEADGVYDLAVNGGGPVVFAYKQEGFLPVQRQIMVPWQEYVWLPEVVLIPPGAPVGVLDLPPDEATAPPRGPRVEDADGVRQAVFLAPPGLSATLVFTDGDKPMNRLTLSVAEYSVGGRGAAALPALPPPGAGYAYAVEVAADEAQEPGAHEVRFSKPLIQYVDNFLKFPVGAGLPSARYDDERSVWVPGPAGRVLKVVGVKDGLAELDLEGKGEAADAAALTALGVGESERRRLAALYAKDVTLWRLPLTGLGAWAVFPALRPPTGAVAPTWPVASVPGHDPAAPRPQPTRQAVPLPGTHFQLCYQSDRTLGCQSPYVVEVALSGQEVPKGLKRIDLEILVAGQRHVKTFPPQPIQKSVFVWDGLDGYLRPVQGRRPAVVRVGYVYDAAPPARQECVLWREQRVMLGDWDARCQGLGGWTLNIHHTYDPIGRVVHFGGGTRREGLNLPPVVTMVAGGTGALIYNDDDQPAVWANLSQPRGLAVGPDGALFIADTDQNRVRRVGPDGLISTVAGTGHRGYDSDNRQAVDAQLNAPTGLAFGPDGSLYIADDGNDRVRRVRPDGAVMAFAGQGGKLDYSGDGGKAVSAQLSLLRGLAIGPGGDVFIAQNGFNQCVRRVGPDGILTKFVGGMSGKTALRTACAVAAAPDGAVYVADGDGCRVWRVDIDGAAMVVAGTGKAGFSGDEGPAVKAELNAPSGLALGPNETLYIADAGNQRIRRVGSDGIITTVAGKGETTGRETGDGGPASRCGFRLSERPELGMGRLCGLAVGPEGELYVADVGHSSVRRVAPPFSGISDSEILITSEDGAELYVFDGVGRHLQTLDGATGAVLYRFVYDAAGRLKEVHEAADAVTRIERDKAGRPHVLIGPDGKRTILETGKDGRLSRVAFPAGEAVEMKYDAGGLLTSFKDAQGHVAHFRYDEAGNLLRE